MITRRLLILQVVILLGMGSVFVLPDAPKSQPVGISLALPPLLGGWYGVNAAVSEKERVALGVDTQFSRKLYRNNLGDEIYVSIVLAGQDMNTSIHRPERCLPAQGLTIVDSKVIPIPLRDKNNNTLSVTRLHNLHPKRTADERADAVYSLTYYWFVGCTDTTASHFQRTYFDIRDRFLRGYNQRWAYVTVTSPINQSSNGDTDKLLQSFIQQLLPRLQEGPVNYH